MSENKTRVDWESATCTDSRFQRESVILDCEVDWENAANKPREYISKKECFTKLLKWILFFIRESPVWKHIDALLPLLDMAAYALFLVFNFVWLGALFLVGWLMTLCPVFALLLVPVVPSYYIGFVLIFMFPEYYREKFNGH